MTSLKINLIAFTNLKWKTLSQGKIMWANKPIQLVSADIFPNVPRIG